MTDEESFDAWLDEDRKLFLWAACKNLLVERCMGCSQVDVVDFQSKLCAPCAFRRSARKPSGAFFRRFKT